MILVSLWTAEAQSLDRNGEIYLPTIGMIGVMGVRYDQLYGHLKTAIGTMFRNFELSVGLGKMRSICHAGTHSHWQPVAWASRLVTDILSICSGCRRHSGNQSIVNLHERNC